MRVLRAVLFLTFTVVAPLRAQASGGSAGLMQALEGAWRQVDVRDSGGRVISNQPAMRFFVDGHYAQMRVEGTQPRVQPDADATPDELRAAFSDAAFTAQAGTYEVNDAQTITMRPYVAKNPVVMAGGYFTTSTVRIVADTLWVTSVRNQSGPATNPASQRYVRVR